MKTSFYLLILPVVLLFSANSLVFAQNKSWTLPEVEIRDLKNNAVSATELANSEGPTIISFWATWCKPCIQELNNINDVYPDWQDETGVKLVAVSIDDTRNAPKVGPMANGKGWEYDVFIDYNSDLRRALNVNTVPHTFLLNSQGNIVWQHNGYTPGEEEDLYELVQKVAETGNIE